MADATVTKAELVEKIIEVSEDATNGNYHQESGYLRVLASTVEDAPDTLGWFTFYDPVDGTIYTYEVADG